MWLNFVYSIVLIYLFELTNPIIRQQPIESKDSKLKALYIEKSDRIKEYTM